MTMRSITGLKLTVVTNFIGALACAISSVVFAQTAQTQTSTQAVAQKSAQTLPDWQPGTLDIHHIATGQGNATLVIFPDGTSMLIDVGATAGARDVTAAPRPDDSKRAGEWVARYTQRHLKPVGRSALDYMLLTHIHPDHIGDVSAATPRSDKGNYRLTGAIDVAEAMPVGVIIDRGFPAYDYPVAETRPYAQNYMAFVKARLIRGERVERFVVGSVEQIKGRGHVKSDATFGVRNIVANGELWSGSGATVTPMFPTLSRLGPSDYPNENMCSIGIKIFSGKFAYFTGGDLTSDTAFGSQPWRDILTPAVKVAGRVDVATADHHGLYDALTPEIAKILRPQAWVLQTWHISHPSPQQLDIMLSEKLHGKAPDVFATNVVNENFRVNARHMRRLRSTDGHVVIRVAPGGANFMIYVTDHQDESDTVKLVAGPYQSVSLP
jgi:glyoxylase-like metal-dependent hydrolase (beta-lactamase superfamily II)